jgi:hypothetical protein
MGWNDSRVTLVARGWTIVDEEVASKNRTTSGSSVRILRPERVEDSGADGLRPEAVRKWFEKRGFRIMQESPLGDRLQWESIEADLGVNESELAEITLTFTLSRNSPDHWQSWKGLVEAICDNWGFCLFDPEKNHMVDASDILRVLSETQAWRDFGNQFHWPSL